jgi:hypothetical protein
VHSGIDPGLSGAVAVLATDGTLVALHDTPLLPLSTSRGTRQDEDVSGVGTRAGARLTSWLGCGQVGREPC